MKTLAKYDRISWFSIMVGAFVGGVASILQAIERMNWAAQPAAPLACDLNNAFSCSNVFGAWQSSVFGFSNSILCLVFFALMFGFGLAAYFSEQTNKIVRLVMHFFALFFLGFGAWYLQQTAFVVGSLCVYCIACYAGVIAINWGWLRINLDDVPMSKDVRKKVERGIGRGVDTFLWILYALLFVFIFAFKFLD